MPTYEYCCGKCGHEFEREQRITEEPIRRCPSCRALKAKRLISATSFVLKGGGWYADLYTSGGKKTDKKEADAPKSEASASESSKDDAAKPAADATSSTKTEKSKKSKKTSAA